MTSKLEGFDELINLFDEMKLKDEEVTSGLRKALKIPKEIAQKNSPVRTGRTRDSIKIKIQKGELGGSTGIVYVSTEEGGKPVAEIQVKPCKEQHGFAADVNGLGEKEALYFSYKGTGAFNFMSFDLK